MYLNPIMVKCFWCGEVSNIAIPKKMSNKKESYREQITYNPCDKCKEKWDKGAVIIEVSESPNGKNQPTITKGFYPTGAWWVVKRELLDSDISFVTEEFVTKEIAKEMVLYNEVHEQ